MRSDIVRCRGESVVAPGRPLGRPLGRLAVLAGLAFRRRFRGSAFVFYLTIASLIMPGLFVGLGIALTFRLLGLPTERYGFSNDAKGNRAAPGFDAAAVEVNAADLQTVIHLH